MSGAGNDFEMDAVAIPNQLGMTNCFSGPRPRPDIEMTGAFSLLGITLPLRANMGALQSRTNKYSVNDIRKFALPR